MKFDTELEFMKRDEKCYLSAIYVRDLPERDYHNCLYAERETPVHMYKREACKTLADYLLNNIQPIKEYKPEYGKDLVTFYLTILQDKEKTDFLVAIDDYQNTIKEEKARAEKYLYLFTREQEKTLWTVFKEKTRQYCLQLQDKYLRTSNDVQG